jgi:hypothetical protein
LSVSSSSDNPDSPRESGELSRKGQKDFFIPNSKKFEEILEKRIKNHEDVYLAFIEKLKQKQENYELISTPVESGKQQRYQDKKTQKPIYLEKHRIMPGHQGGEYIAINTLLLTFYEHIMSHYLRYKQYGDVKDLKAYTLMLTNSIEARRQFASEAGKLGGTKQQQILKEQKAGWFNSQAQRERGKKGAATARQRGVGAYDPGNIKRAQEIAQDLYQSDANHRAKMKTNLKVGTVQKNGIVVNYYNEKGELEIYQRFKSPYTSYSERKGIEYSEERLHMSEDFFWNHIKHSRKPSDSYDIRETDSES